MRVSVIEVQLLTRSNDIFRNILNSFYILIVQQNDICTPATSVYKALLWICFDNRRLVDIRHNMVNDLLGPGLVAFQSWICVREPLRFWQFLQNCLVRRLFEIDQLLASSWDSKATKTLVSFEPLWLWPSPKLSGDYLKAHGIQEQQKKHVSFEPLWFWQFVIDQLY